MPHQGEKNPPCTNQPSTRTRHHFDDVSHELSVLLPPVKQTNQTSTTTTTENNLTFVRLVVDVVHVDVVHVDKSQTELTMVASTMKAGISAFTRFALYCGVMISTSVPVPASASTFMGRSTPLPVWGKQTVPQKNDAHFLIPRGGESTVDAASTTTEGATTTAEKNTDESEKEEELSLDQKVWRTMKRLGLSRGHPDGPSESLGQEKDDELCKDGVCALPSATTEATGWSGPETASVPTTEQNPQVLADKIASDMGVAGDLAMAALGATSELLPDGERRLNEDAARSLIQQELDIIDRIPHDSKEVSR